MRSFVLRLHAVYGQFMTVLAIAAGAALFALMWLICANSISRKVLNAPIVGTLEITEAAMPFVILLAMAFTQFRDGHIRVTLLTDRLPERAESVIYFVTLLIGALFFAWVAYATWGFAYRSFRVGETAWGVIRIPLWPSKMVISVGAAFLALQYLLDAARLLVGTSASRHDASDRLEPGYGTDVIGGPGDTDRG